MHNGNRLSTHQRLPFHDCSLVFRGNRQVAAPRSPNHVCGETEQHNPYGNECLCRGVSDIANQRVGNDDKRGDYEQHWRPWITWNLVRSFAVRHSLSIHKDRRCRQTVEYPSAENNISQQIIKGAGQREHRSAYRAGYNCERRGAKTRVYFRELAEEQTVVSHRVVNARTSERIAVGSAEDRDHYCDSNELRCEWTDYCDEGVRRHAFRCSDTLGTERSDISEVCDQVNGNQRSRPAKQGPRKVALGVNDLTRAECWVLPSFVRPKHSYHREPESRSKRSGQLTRPYRDIRLLKPGPEPEQRNRHQQQRADFYRGCPILHVGACPGAFYVYCCQNRNHRDSNCFAHHGRQWDDRGQCCAKCD